MQTACISITIGILCITTTFSKGEILAMQESKKRIEIPKSDIVNLIIREGKLILVAAKRTPVSIKDVRLQGLSQVTVTCYHLDVNDAKLCVSVLGYLRFYAFDMWTLADLGKKNAHIIGYDVEGMNPLEPPNNPMGRLTIAISDLLSEEPHNKEMTKDVAREAFRSNYARHGQRTYIRGKRILLENASYISATMWDKSSGICVGITNKEGLWAKAFNVDTLNWEKDLGFVKGEFVDVAVAPARGAIGILTAEQTGRIGYRSIKSATDLTDSNEEIVTKTINWKNGEHALRVAVAGDGEETIAGIIVEKQMKAAKDISDKTQTVRWLIVYRRRNGVWQNAGSYVIETSSDGISLLFWNNLLLCAYSYAKDGKTYGVVRILTPESSTLLPASETVDLRNK